MIDGDDLTLARLRDDYGGEWFIGRTYLDREKAQPHWWKAKRKRRLTRREEYLGLSVTIFGDTAADLREALEAEAEREARIGARLEPGR